LPYVDQALTLRLAALPDHWCVANQILGSTSRGRPGADRSANLHD
jgi:hypothetical protein